MKEHIQRFNSYALSVIEHVGLMVISVATVVSMGSEILKMFDRLEVTLSDLLMLFLYLEVIAMVQRYYTSGKMPVRFPLYIGIVALARYMILDMKLMTEWRMMAIAAAILILALAILLIRYGHVRFPYSSDENPQRTEQREERD